MDTTTDDQLPSGFFLLPIVAQWAREGVMNVRDGLVSSDALSLLVCLCAHENHETREAFPSVRRLATLAGLSPSTAGPTLRRVAEQDNPAWTIHRRTIGYGRTRHVYRMGYPAYDGTAPGDWIRIARSLVLGGVWSLLTPAARRLYLVLRAHEWHVDRAMGQWTDDEDLAGQCLGETFVPASVSLNTGLLRELTGHERRTISDARQLLIDSTLARITPRGSEDGLIMTTGGGCYSPAVLERLEADEERGRHRDPEPGTAYTRRTADAMRRADERRRRM